MRKNKNKKAIITGATGYIGSNLVKSLLDMEWELVAIIRESSSLSYINNVKNKLRLFIYDYDINKLIDLFCEFEPDMVFHLASSTIVEHSSEDIDTLINSNVLFGSHLLEAMKKSETAKLVNTCTFWQHYMNDYYNPVNLYAATKVAFKAIIKYYIEAEGFSVINLEIYDTYGIGDKRLKILNLLNNAKEKHSKIEMSLGEQEINLVYIDDIVKAYLRAADILFEEDNIAKDSEFLVKSEETIKLKELVEIYEKVNNTKLDIRLGERPYRKREVMKIWNQGKILPGWKAETKLEDGLKLLKDEKRGNNEAEHK